MVIAASLTGLLAVVLARALSQGGKHMVQADLSFRSQSDLRDAMTLLERDFRELIDFRVTSSTEIIFTIDSHRALGFSPTADQDLDGLPNGQDDDLDGDLWVIPAPTATWTRGFNIPDDDDDGDGKRDVQVRYYVSGRSLLRDLNINEAGWGDNLTTVVSHLGPTGFRIRYFGNAQEVLGRQIDLGDDGVPTIPPDAGEGDGIISEREIDWVRFPPGNGNRSGSLDAEVEREYIFILSISLDQDRNQDGTPDFSFKTEIAPVLLALRRILV